MSRLLRQQVLVLTLALPFVAILGCQDEEIRHYKVPRTEPPMSRMLAVVLPVGDKVWFVNVTGPDKSVVELRSQFDQFVQSIRFPENERRRITWELPAGWQKEASRNRMIHATFRAGPHALEVRISALGENWGGLLANVNRWRKQIGLAGITEKELPTVIKPLSVNGVSATSVDMVGPSPHGPRQMEPDPSTTPAASSDDIPVFDVPGEWEKLPIPRGSMRVASFKVKDGTQSAEVSVIPLAGQAGGILANVNRWRGEVGLQDTTDQQLRKESKMLNTRAGPVIFVDLLGPESAGDKRERTLGGILLHSGQSWFFKLRGPAELVAKQQVAFEAFLQSLRFDTPPGEDK